MKKTKVNSSFETLAAFWIPGQPETVLAGTLSSREGRTYFLTAPAFEILDSTGVKEAFLNMGHLESENSIECLHGRTQDEDCTILWLTEVHSPGVTDFRSNEKISARKFRVSASILGLRVSHSTSAEIESATFRFSDIHEWMPNAWTMDFLEDEVVYRLPRKAYELFSFTSLHLDAEVRCELRVAGSNNKRSGTSIVPVPVVKIIPRQRQSLEWFVELVPRLENFFSLLLGSSVAPKQVGFSREDKTGWLVQHQRSKRQKPNLQLWVKCPPHVFAGAMAKWLAVQGDKQAIEKTLLGTLRKSSLFVGRVHAI